METVVTHAQLILGLLGSFASSGYLIYITIFKNKITIFDKILKLIISVSILWLGIIYLLVLIHVIPFTGYGIYIRPILLIITTAPALEELMRRRNSNENH
jgi:hypothetical protein